MYWRNCSGMVQAHSLTKGAALDDCAVVQGVRAQGTDANSPWNKNIARFRQELIVARYCRFCKTPLQHVFVDLGMSPLSNAFLAPEDLDKAEKFYPLKTRVCSGCLLVQLEQFETPDYVQHECRFFSSYSEDWLNHARTYVDMITQRLALNRNSLVMELASNDGYLLQYFTAKQVPVLGIEAAENIAEVARKKGINTINELFGVKLATQLAGDHRQADLLIGNNVLAHAPDLNDFVAGMKLVLKDDGIITLEFPHLLQLVRHVQFDTIYHEHFAYFSLYTVRQIFAWHGLRVFDVERLATRGGSLRIYACHAANGQQSISNELLQVIKEEAQAGLHTLPGYMMLASQVMACKRDLLRFLLDLRDRGRTVVAYGAPAKANTLLNYCGIREDLIDYTVDSNPHKQGKFLPGTHIPVCSPTKLFETKPDFILILPWNLQQEISARLAAVREWGCQFVVPMPQVQILP